MTKKSVRLRIEGRVQGVWYRAWTMQTAQAAGLDGWVENRRDGSVEVALSGPGDVVDAMIRACWQGPPAARVSNIHIEPEGEDIAPGFHQRGTF